MSFNVNPTPTAIDAPMAIAMLHANADTSIGMIVSPTPSCVKPIANTMAQITALITDAGRTTVEPGTITCLAIGPDSDEKIDKITKELKLF